MHENDEREQLGPRDVEATLLRDEVDPAVAEEGSERFASLRAIGSQSSFEVEHARDDLLDGGEPNRSDRPTLDRLNLATSRVGFLFENSSTLTNRTRAVPSRYKVHELRDLSLELRQRRPAGAEVAMAISGHLAELLRDSLPRVCDPLVDCQPVADLVEEVAANDVLTNAQRVRADTSLGVTFAPIVAAELPPLMTMRPPQLAQWSSPEKR